jgi:integrase
VATRRLTDELIKAIPLPPLRDGKPTYTLHRDVGRGSVEGLRLRVTTGGTRAFVLSARFPSGKQANGRHNPTMRKVGEWPYMPLDQARAIAATWNADITQGIDPQEKAKRAALDARARADVAAREEARKRAGTFANFAEQYLARRVSKMRTSHQIAGVIRRDLISRWGKTPVVEVSKTDVINMLEDIEAAKGKYAAHQAFSHARALFAWLLEREDPKNPTLGIMGNPTAGVNVNKLIGERKPRQRTLTDREIALIWKATEGDPAVTYPIGPYLRLLLILGVRRNELAEATWAEFDFDGSTWKLEDTRTKNGETRTIPLPGMAVDILSSLPRFTGGANLFSSSAGRAPWTSYDRSKKQFDRKVAKLNDDVQITPWRFHDLRRTARSNWSALEIPFVVAELMLGHRQGGVAAHYDHHTYGREMRAGFEAWCARLRSIVEPRPDNVVALRT